jgi:choline dehydrogenase
MDARIEANYLSDAEGFDLKMMLECAKLSRELFAQKSLRPVSRCAHPPGAQ